MAANQVARCSMEYDLEALNMQIGKMRADIEKAIVAVYKQTGSA